MCGRNDSDIVLTLQWIKENTIAKDNLNNLKSKRFVIIDSIKLISGTSSTIDIIGTSLLINITGTSSTIDIMGTSLLI